VAVSKRVRFEVLRRDGHRCRYCGASADDGAVLTVDHVMPQALGGGDEPGNLVAACRDCNSGKSSSNPDAATIQRVSDDALRWRNAMARAAEDLAQELEVARAFRGEFEGEWNRWTSGFDKRRNPLPNDWENRVDGWRLAGLPLELIVDSIGIAMRSQADRSAKFPYLCGVLRNRGKELHDRAQAILDAAVGEEEADEPFACIHDVDLRDGLFTGIRLDWPHAGPWECGAHDGEMVRFWRSPDRLLEAVVDGTLDSTRKSMVTNFVTRRRWVA